MAAVWFVVLTDVGKRDGFTARFIAYLVRFGDFFSLFVYVMFIFFLRKPIAACHPDGLLRYRSCDRPIIVSTVTNRVCVG